MTPLLLTWPAPWVVTWALHPWAGVEELWEKVSTKIDEKFAELLQKMEDTKKLDVILEPKVQF